MTKLTEHTVLARTRAQDLKSVRKLNAWGSELTDVSIVKSLPNVEVLSLSVNNISTLQDFAYCKNLQELYLRKNKVVSLNELRYLKDLTHLHSLWLADNPCAEEEHYRFTVIRNLPQLLKLDNQPIVPSESEQAKTLGISLDELEGTVPSIHSPIIDKPHSDPILSNDSCPDFVSELTSSKTSTPIISPVDSFQAKFEEPVRVNNSSTEDSSNNQFHSCEQNFEVSSHQFYNESQSNSTIKHLSSGEPKPVYELDLPLDRPDLVANEKFHASTAPGHLGRYNVRLERSSAIKLLPKGGRNRNANILSAVLCLIKELDLPSLEVVDTAVHCQMEELEAEQDADV